MNKKINAQDNLDKVIYRFPDFLKSIEKNKYKNLAEVVEAYMKENQK